MERKNYQGNVIFRLVGWLLFLVCAVFFIIGSLESASKSMLIASIVFFVACLVFIYPLVMKH